MASSAAGDPSLPPPPPRGWLSCLVSGAGRLLAAALDPDSSASDTTTSSPESSQSPPRRALVPADDGTGTCIASDSCQLNLSGKEIVLKDSSNGSFAVVSEIDPKEAVKQLLIQDTYSRTQQHPVAYSSSRNTSRQEDLEIPAYSPGFDNTVQKEWLKKSSTSIKGLGTKNHERSQPSILQVMKRRYSSIGATFEESRRVRLKQNGSSTSGKNDKFTVGNDSCSASKLMFQEDIEAAPSASMGFHPVNSSKSYTRGFNLESNIPTKTRSPVPASRSRRPNNRQTARPSNWLPQLNNTAPAGQEPDAGRIQAKRPVGRPRRERR
ncbi:hypothetical protein PAHAL_1G057200 [Panicum hallii]|uniref:Uncharacterized protein n=1 Tax=Panicum hallii TaxID=206008 RepID=A0A2T8KU80_9POAL|nr:hypothetical protein PAHAL_1G057200 [Panicum hallii]